MKKHVIKVNLLKWERVYENTINNFHKTSLNNYAMLKLFFKISKINYFSNNQIKSILN